MTAGCTKECRDLGTGAHLGSWLGRVCIGAGPQAPAPPLLTRSGVGFSWAMRRPIRPKANAMGSTMLPSEVTSVISNAPGKVTVNSTAGRVGR